MITRQDAPWFHNVGKKEMEATLIPAGYMYKQVVPRPDWEPLNKASAVRDICSVSPCISKMFANYIPHWRHNGYWFFDRPEIMREIAASEGIDLSSMTLLYFELYQHEYDVRTEVWSSFKCEDFETKVVVPPRKTLLGFDVVTYSVRTSPECSPLSCNGLAAEIPTNEHCLLDSVAFGKKALETELFDNSEPGPFRILAVYRID